MAGDFRCSRGHTWTAEVAVACPACGCTAFVGVEPATAVALAAGLLPPAPPPADHAPTLEFAAPQPADTPDPSFSSLVVIADSSGSGTVVRPPSSVVPFGPVETVDFIAPEVPGYEIVHEVGRGGMGVVYKARQLSLNRTVALKMILSGAHAGPVERERFRREAEAVAALQNPHIVQIFDIGEANGHPYLALEFVDGGSLAQQLSGEPWAPNRAAELVEVLARTMQFAHDAGIVHRDLKPGNILLGKDEGRRMKDESRPADPPGSSSSFILRPSSFRPKVTDFGLAKRLDETLNDGGGTRTGAVMGTPSYIAPEQASGKSRDVGPPADVYALGAILYELLTGRPPFRGETPLDTVLQVLHDDPVPPKRLSPLVPRDLETICLKCLSKSAGKRYATADALAADLRRYLNGEPILARPLSAWGRGLKWARRHPALAVLFGVTATATVALVAVLGVSYARVRDAVTDREHEARTAAQARDRAELLRVQAEALAKENERGRVEAVQRVEELKRETERNRRAAYALQLSQVAILCDRDPVRAAALLDNEQRCPKDLRDFTWHYLRRLCQREDRAYTDHPPTDPLRAVAYAPGAMFVATAGDAGQVRVWDPRSGRTLAALAGHAGAVHGLAFSPDGTAIASAGADGTVRLWELPLKVLDMARKARDAATPFNWAAPVVDWVLPVVPVEPAITLAAHAGGALCVAFSPDGRTLVSGGRDGNLQWWDLTAWHPAPPDVAALGGPGAVAVGLGRAARATDARPVRPLLAPVEAHAEGVLALSFSQNGKLLATGGADRLAKVWAGDGSRLLQTLPRHADAVRAVAVSPDGNTVATVQNGKPPTIRLFSAQTWRDRRLFGHTGYIFALAFSDDGQLLASAGFDKTVRLWDADDGRERGLLTGHAQQVTAVAFAPDRKTVVSAAMDATAVVWQTNTRTHEPDDLLRSTRDGTARAPGQSVAAVGVGGAGSAFAVADDTGWVRMFAADYVRPGGAAPPVPGPLALTPLPYGATPFPREPARAAAASADGRTFVVATGLGLLVWQPFPFAPNRLDAPNRPPRGAFTRPTLVRTPAPVHAVAIDPTGRWIATADPTGVRAYDLRLVPLGSERLVDLEGGTLVMAGEGVREVVFHPTREWLAVAVESGVRVVTLRGKVLANVPKAHTPGGTTAQVVVDAIAFDRGGGQLATGDASGLIKLWAVDADGRVAHARDLPGHAGAVYALAFSPDGRTLASGGDDRAVILWDPVGGQERLALAGHADRVLDVSFNAAGTALVTVSRDGAVKRWRADVRPTAEGSPRMTPAIPRT